MSNFFAAVSCTLATESRLSVVRLLLTSPRAALIHGIAHSHFRNGKLVVGKMIPHACPVKKIVYTSQDPNVKSLVVIFRGYHSHPPWPAEKPTLEAKQDMEKCLSSMGTMGTTGGRLNNCKSHLHAVELVLTYC